MYSQMMGDQVSKLVMVITENLADFGGNNNDRAQQFPTPSFVMLLSFNAGGGAQPTLDRKYRSSLSYQWWFKEWEDDGPPFRSTS